MGAAVIVGGSDSATGTILGADDSNAATVSLDLLVATLDPLLCPLAVAAAVTPGDVDSLDHLDRESTVCLG